MHDAFDLIGSERIGSFRIVRELGRGGMGVVYLAERVQDFTQRVAIKLLHANALTGAGEEAILRSLDHPGIVRFLDVGRTPQGTPYLVMEYVDGLPLDVYCSQKKLGQAKRIGLLLQAADAVAHAHSRFVTHADLKPANLLVTEDGAVKLLDFGIAAQRVSAESGASIPYHTPAFSSPEQRFGAQGTVAIDIFALGKTAGLLLAQAPEPVSTSLAAILKKACRQEPEARYRTARQFAQDLQAFLELRPVQAYRRDRLYSMERWLRRNPVSAGLLFFLLLVVVGSTLGIVTKTVRSVHSRRVTQARLEELVAQTGTLQGQLYDSLPADPAADAARTSLLLHANQTLDELTAQSGDDPKLAKAVADQYRSLAHLQRAMGQVAAAQQNLRRSEALDDRSDGNLPAH